MRKYRGRALAILLTIGFAGAFVLSQARVSATVPGTNTVVSVDSSGNQGNGHSGDWQLMSRNGKYMTYTSYATNLVASDSNAKRDVFLRDLAGNTTTRISVSSSGVESNGHSDVHAISESGKYIVFKSAATNLIDGTTSPANRIYIRDVSAGTTAFADTNGAGTLLATYSRATGVSNDGRFVLGETLGVGWDENSNPDYYHPYLNDRVLGTWTTLDVPTSGGQQNYDSMYSVMNCDGAFIAFSSEASNLTSGDSNGVSDVFLVDMRNGKRVTNITSSLNGHSRKPSFSCNGNYLGFTSQATNAVVSPSVSSPNNGHYYRYDRINGGLLLLDQTSGGSLSSGSASFKPELSDRGDAVFQQNSNNIGNNYYNVAQVYFRNVSSSTTEILSINSSGDASSTAIYNPGISADGKTASFNVDQTTNLLSTDTNGYQDVYLAQTGL